MCDKKSSKIADNPSVKEVSDLVALTRLVRGVSSLAIRLGFRKEGAERMVERATAILEDVDLLKLPDRFNAAFARDGWIATSSLSADVMKQALGHWEAGQTEEAEEVILEWFTEANIRQFAIQGSRRFNKTRGRIDQLKEALALTAEERFMAAVPLILIACDGFVSEVLGTSPFEKDADLSVFDSIVGHPTSLPALIGMLRKGVRKTSDEPLDVPLRHGILHGRSLGYANRRVCYKAWMLMIAVVDWAIDKRDEAARREAREEEQNLSWRTLLGRLQKNAIQRKAIDTFTPIKWRGPYHEDAARDEPPYAFWEFLHGWRRGNFGVMAGRAVNTGGESHARLAGRIRRDAELVELLGFEIHSVEQTALCRSEAQVVMRGRAFGRRVEGRFRIGALRLTAEGDMAMPGEAGQWYIQPRCIFDLMHERTIPIDRAVAEDATDAGAMTE